MICLQVVYLFLEDFRPEILADKLDCLKMVTEAWPLHCIPLRELMADLITDSLDATSGELRLGGVETITVRRNHLYH